MTNVERGTVNLEIEIRLSERIGPACLQCGKETHKKKPFCGAMCKREFQDKIINAMIYED